MIWILIKMLYALARVSENWVRRRQRTPFSPFITWCALRSLHLALHYSTRPQMGEQQISDLLVGSSFEHHLFLLIWRSLWHFNRDYTAGSASLSLLGLECTLLGVFRTPGPILFCLLFAVMLADDQRAPTATVLESHRSSRAGTLHPGQCSSHEDCKLWTYGRQHILCSWNEIHFSPVKKPGDSSKA